MRVGRPDPGETKCRPGKPLPPAGKVQRGAQLILRPAARSNGLDRSNLATAADGICDREIAWTFNNGGCRSEGIAIDFFG